MNQKNEKQKQFPNPSFERKSWKSLNGAWAFAFDPENLYEKETISNIKFPLQIQVPFCHQSALSGIQEDVESDYLWYQRTFEVTSEELEGSVLLRFGAVDYTAKVWINGSYVGRHDGGFTSFYFEVSNYLHTGENVLTVKVEDSYSKEYPRGKQMWGKEPTQCFYINTTGIWQNVWLEFTGKNYLTSIHITPDLDHNQAKISIRAMEEKDITLCAEFRLGERELGELTMKTKEGKSEGLFTFEEFGPEAVIKLWWTPEIPNLVDVKVTLMENGTVVDEVYTYFGMRKIHREGDKIFLNNSLLYQRLVLDQGYWPESLMTPPTEDALKKDVELTKAMGFNGARKHQKIEDPLYYYWADKLGLLVWGELPSAYDFTPNSRKNLMDEMHASSNSSTNTGDQQPVMVMMAMLVLSAAAMLFVSKRKRAR